MKKILSVLVVVSLLFVMCIPAFAGENVDALTDVQQKEIATLVLNSVKAGNDPETILGRSAIEKDVIDGIADFAPYKTAYDTDASSIGVIVSLAVTAANADAGDNSFSPAASKRLTSALTLDIVNKITPETTTGATTAPSEDPTAEGNVIYLVTLLSNLKYDQIESTLVTLVGNQAITADTAKSVANSLYLNGTITAEQKTALYAAVTSDEASTNVVDKFFEGYTPADLSQLFRGFGDSIGGMTAAIAGLFRNASGGGSGTTGGDSTGGNPSDIPATGDFAIPAVAAIAVAAGLALVLTKKKDS